MAHVHRFCLIALSTLALSCATAGEGVDRDDGDGDGAGPDGSPTQEPDATTATPLTDAAPRADATIVTTADAGLPGPDATAVAYEGSFWVLEDYDGTARGGIGGRLIPTSFWGPDAGSFAECTMYVDVPSTGGSAGNVTVEGAKVPVTLTPVGGMSPFVDYGASGMPANVYDPGDVITFTGTGGPDVGPFTGSVVGPQKLASVAFPSQVSLTTPFTVTWDAGDGDFALVWLSTWPVQGLLFCTVPDTGNYTIPVGALELIPTGNDVAVFQMYRINQTNVTADDSIVHLWGADSWTGPSLPIGP